MTKYINGTKISEEKIDNAILNLSKTFGQMPKSSINNHS